jgi:hypothetical protein
MIMKKINYKYIGAQASTPLSTNKSNKHPSSSATVMDQPASDVLVGSLSNKNIELNSTKKN